jgi:hypothetical protein
MVKLFSQSKLQYGINSQSYDGLLHITSGRRWTGEFASLPATLPRPYRLSIPAIYLESAQIEHNAIRGLKIRGRKTYHFQLLSLNTVSENEWPPKTTANDSKLNFRRNSLRFSESPPTVGRILSFGLETFDRPAGLVGYYFGKKPLCPSRICTIQ